MGAADIIKQHLIDPEICIRCNTCEDTCPIDAITHDDRNYVVKADVCNACNACLSPCPTGAIDNWRTMLKGQAYTIEAQLTWDELPEEVPLPEAEIEAAAAAGQVIEEASRGSKSVAVQEVEASRHTSSRAPWSAAHPYVNLHGVREPVTATVAGNYRLTAEDASSDIHHIVLDFGNHFFPVLEGQAIGIVPPGTDASGKPHYIRMYSVASPRDGERPGYNNLALTVKRVDTDHDGNPVRGVASNFLCDLAKGDPVQVVGPFGSTFLMPNHREASVMMICTGTGSAPMRAMTERMRRNMDHFSGRRLLFFGARNRRELPYFGPLLKLPKDFLDIHFAFSRDPEVPRRYVQDAIREASAQVAALLADPHGHIYICGLKGMEEGVLDAFAEVCATSGQSWQDIEPRLRAEGRLHIETY
ncbi:benzoyl-CoA 2,3-epoxidase subunit A [Cupriavidus metallidurans]|jgi:benzoyl-CoA 2,3-epoxidase subunit A|uniref:Benzoyl-CoA oxygenase component A n=1 Tax=Cupriavidus metallidurans TaxID=119219 RepID=A0A2L0X043_9BURK|nr:MULTISPECIES: benzoyl-CoA 2,3-epoxidase subunit BoxA [Cupriavidus]AVA33445.1 benzoyl-CoA 2,3-epoxidase subunit BoxA [Cupriavidus metallidurans]KWR78967.1 benzoyl-CoA oxygenase [Cupriavidus sp. SHE]MDE4917615.1 benzoyl-CoA 2,3-epoxidase subunit BoxA [Cupriavidus metallidurans]QBP09441.1 benzoyl-CoA 2,3-epoxidase subunit BoxA [Cupriavidus metallidurans]QWC89793.1 benzoyl-CoA 2,3-epoxidase subunit BoxA [Cupriavidus metallidurans]